MAKNHSFYDMTEQIEIHLNGAVTSLSQPQSLGAFLAQLEIDLKQVAIEHNRHIITRSQLNNVMLQSGDEVEIVEFIGGG